MRTISLFDAFESGLLDGGEAVSIVDSGLSGITDTRLQFAGSTPAGESIEFKGDVSHSIVLTWEQIRDILVSIPPSDSPV